MDRFDIYFASLMAITIHPGFGREGTYKPDMMEIAQLALQMIELRNSIEDKIKCLG